MDESFKRVGRGGAGNFVKDAVKKSEDLEAQKSSSSSYTPPLKPASPSEYSRVGRGGAGNWAATAEISKLESPGRPAGEKAAYKGHAGRGGAGNFRAAAEEEIRAAVEKEKEAGKKLEEQVRADVEAGLPPPPKAYRSSRGEDVDLD